MARTALTVQEIALAGLTDPTFSAANADGHSVANDGSTFLYVKNGSGGAITVTVQTPAKKDGMDIDELEVSVGAAGEEVIGFFPPGTFNQSDGTIYVDFSAVTSLTIAAMK